jgi:hypothetical protein
MEKYKWTPEQIDEQDFFVLKEVEFASGGEEVEYADELDF